jgi:hypothetical protein
MRVIGRVSRHAALVALAFSGLVRAQDGDALESKSLDLVEQIDVATSYTSSAYADIYRAVGNKEKAEKLTSISDDLKGHKQVSNKDSLKIQIAAVNDAGAGLDKVDLAGAKLSDSAKADLSSSMLKMGVASYLDGVSVKTATDLVSKGNESLKSLSGFAAMKQAPPIKRSITNSNWVLANAPPQVKQLGAAMAKVSEYSKAHGIATPTQDQIDAKAKSLEKE